MRQVRQGDVLIHPVPSLPPTGAPVALEQGRTVLAHGEVTGHHHSFAPECAVALLEAPGDEATTMLRYLKVDALSELVHQEHRAIPIEPGVGRVIRQREYHWYENRQVLD